MLRVGTDNHDFASATNDFALLAHGLDRRSDLHFEPPAVFVSTQTMRFFAHAIIVYQHFCDLQGEFCLSKNFR